MFEKIKGLKAGGVVAEQFSSATMNIVNYLINKGVELKTDDTLLICFNFYNYCMILTLENHKILSKTALGGRAEKKAIKFFGGLGYQSKTLLKEWLQNATGVYEIDPFIENLDKASIDFEMDVREKNSLGKNASIKSYYPNAILESLCNHFGNNSKEFKNSIGKQLESIRIAIG